MDSFLAELKCEPIIQRILFFISLPGKYTCVEQQVETISVDIG